MNLKSSVTMELSKEDLRGCQRVELLGQCRIGMLWAGEGRGIVENNSWIA